MPLDTAPTSQAPRRTSSSANTPSASAQAAPKAPQPTIEQNASPPPAPHTVTVRAGDTLTHIAKDHQTTVAALVEHNPQIKNPDLIYAGQVLALPPGASSGAGSAPSQATAEGNGSATRAPVSPELQRASRERAAAASQAAAARLGAVTPSASEGTAGERSPSGTRLEAHIRAGNVLREGDRGPEVLDLQRFLGMKTSEQDGVFGTQTRAELESFQARNNLDADGTVGPKTLEELRNTGRVTNDARSLDAHMEVGAVLKEGDRGDHIRALQRKLGMSPAGQTGVFGATTRAEVEAFQRDAMGMSPSSAGFGTVGPTTAKKLDAAASAAARTTQASGSAQVSARGQEQMRRLVDHARAHNVGSSNGRCFEYVWSYLHSSGYGKIDGYSDLPGMRSELARHFSDFMNASPANLREAGLQRLDTAMSPPITNPHDRRIPAGAVIVVAPGSTGTSHESAGDIVVKGSRAGEFINDGPAMYYGTAGTWRGRVLGVYVPE